MSKPRLRWSSLNKPIDSDPKGSSWLRRQRRGLLLAALVAAVVLMALAATAVASATTSPVLTGKVTGVGGAALANARVQVLSGTTVVAQTETGRLGNYAVYVAAGTYDVKISHGTYMTQDNPTVAVAAPTTTLDAALTRLPVLTGKVTGVGGAALANARVQVLSGTTVVAQTETGRLGNYAVYVAAGTYDVKISHGTYMTQDNPTVAVAAPTTTLDAALTRLPVLTGKVTGVGGAALANARVQVLSGTTVVAQTETGRLGNYAVYVAAGTYDVKISHGTYMTQDNPTVAVAAPTTTLDAALTRLPVLTGKVTGVGGAALANAQVQVLSGTTVVAQTETGRLGNYAVYVAAGTYDVKISHGTYMTQDNPTVAVAAPTTTLDAALTKLP